MDASSTCLIETRHLTRIYGNGVEVRALDGVSIRVARGEFVAVMGPSGSGKSTLLNMLGGLDKPTSGQVIVDGQDLGAIRNKDAFRAKTVGFIFQLHNLLPTLTAQENIEVPMMGHAGFFARRKRAAELLALVGLSERMKFLPNQLSGGERQRVAVARALANNPPLVLADEPTGSLDTASGQALMDLLRDLNQGQGTTFLVVTHDPAIARQTKRVLVMEDGKVVREDIIGSPLEEDLKMWQHSGLGQRLLSGDYTDLEELDLSEQQRRAIQRLLKSTDKH